jgi:cytochrome c peroxidase
MLSEIHPLRFLQSKYSSLLSFAYALLQGLGIVLTPAPVRAEPVTDPLVDIGRILFFDVNLSKNRTQSCASCHDPERGFIDGRDNGIGGAASLGDDGRSLGGRNTPSTAYASLTPSFHQNDEGNYIGGQFLDGRAATLAIQATEPLTNPIEMALPDDAAVSIRVQENPNLKEMLIAQFGADLFSDIGRTLAAIAASISAFEKTNAFAAFDSKYDRHLRGDYKMTAREELGRSLFFSELTNCSSCHLLNISSLKEGETFTNYRYHNIGVPPNLALKQKNARAVGHRDRGLLEHPALSDPELAGKFKVPSLRNVAITGPYMHNGIFRELRTAILFYNKYTIRTKQSQTNPETGIPWGAAEVPETIDTALLNQGQPIDDGRAKALIAFLNTLTDARYESLINP